MAKKLKLSQLLNSLKVLDIRKKIINKGKVEPISPSNVNKVAYELHPGEVTLEIVSIKEEINARTIRFINKDKVLPYFEAGQFMTLSMQIGNSYVSRPYSIKSAPFETLLENPYIEITVKRVNEGFVSNYLLDDAKVGDRFKSLIGLGQFNLDEIRDAHHIIALAGGSGITPFVSMAREINHGDLDFELTIIYGSRNSNEILLKDELDSLISEKIHVVHVISDEPNYDGHKGFITKDIIKQYIKGDTSFFMCGPNQMINFINNELKEMGVPERRIRRDHMQQNRVISSYKDYPQEFKDKTFNITVRLGQEKVVIPASSNESILVALERSSIKLDNSCRGGYCGFCRTKLLSGNVYIYKDVDYRRESDKEFNYVHACSTYPLSDLEINIPIKN